MANPHDKSINPSAASPARPADAAVERSTHTLGSRFRLISRYQIKTWHALLGILFVAGFASATVFGVKEGYFEFGMAETLIDFKIVSSSEIGTCPGLVCGNLCYTQSYVKCVDGTAQLISYSTNYNKVYVTEQPHALSFAKDSDARVTFTITNPTAEPFTIQLNEVRWQPKVLIEYGSFAFNTFRTKVTPLDGMMEFALAPAQQRDVSYKLPTNELTLAGNFLFMPIVIDKNSYRYGLPFLSKPISIYDAGGQMGQCGAYTHTKTPLAKAMCLSGDVYVPLGAQGCTEDNDCVAEKKCVQNHCAPSIRPDTNPSRVKLLLLTLYFNSNADDVALSEDYLKDQMEKLHRWWVRQTQTLALTRVRPDFQYQRCNLSRDEFTAILNAHVGNDAFDEVYRRCGVDDSYSHRYLLLSFDDSASTMTNPLYKLQYERMYRIHAMGIYVGKGRMYGIFRPNRVRDQIDELSETWLHEMFHSFGAPDLYVNAWNMDGASFIWGNCMLMKGETDINLDAYDLCPLEAHYFSRVDGGIPPQASLGAVPLLGNAPLVVAFDASDSTDTDGTIASYAWNFGDGQNGSGATTTHTYVNAGTYTVLLTVTDNQDLTATATQDITVTQPITYLLTLTKSGTGTITSNPAGIDCGNDCSETYASGTQVTLNATPDAGSIFAGWSGDCAGTGSCMITMSQNRSVNASFTAQSSGWWHPSWQYRKKISFNNAAQAENLTGFPALVKLDTSRIDYAKTQNQGQDIRFIDEDDATVLAYEIEQWNELGTSYVWVRVPQIDQSNTDYIWMYYGNASAADGQNATGVWDSNFKLVHHLKETSGQHQDSTTNSNNSIAVTVTTQGSATGKINGTDDFDGVDDLVTIADSASFDIGTGNATWEAWVALDDNAFKFNGIMSHTNGTAATDGWWITAFPETPTYCPGGSGCITISMNDTDYNSNPLTWTSGTFYYVTVVKSGTTISFYRNGVFLNSVNNGKNINNSAGTFRVGMEGSSYGTGYLDGRIDEVRVSNIARSANWIAAQYRSMTDVFNSFGSEESASVSDTTAPTVTAFTPSVSSLCTGGSVTLSWTATDNVGVDRVEVWYNPGAGWVQVPSGDCSGSKTASGSCLTSPSATMQYGVHAIDAAGNCINEAGIHCGGVASDSHDPRTAMRPDTVTVNTVPGTPGDPSFSGTGQTSTTFSFPEPQGAWYLVSLPVVPEDRSVGNLFPGAVVAYGWDYAGQKYEKIETLEPKRGYWLLFTGAASATMCGSVLDSYTQDYPTPGWDMIGSVRNPAVLTDNPPGSVVEMWGWDASTQSYVPIDPFQTEPMQGYWIKVMDAPSSITVGGSVPAAVPSSVITPSWSLPLTTSAGNSRDSITLGTAPNATDAYDRGLDRSNPPPGFSGIDASFVSTAPDIAASLQLSRDYRSNAQTPINWKLILTGTQGQSGTLAWNASESPSQATLTLFKSDGTRVDMRAVREVQFTGDQQFTIALAKANGLPTPPVKLLQSVGKEGSSTKTKTPSFTFTISDPDKGQKIGYQIQVARDKDFTNLARDYTWGGSTTNPNPVRFDIRRENALAKGNYWWRVRGTDEKGAFSEWVYFGDRNRKDFTVR